MDRWMVEISRDGKLCDDDGWVRAETGDKRKKELVQIANDFT